MSILASGLWSVLLGLFVNTAAQSFLYATLPSVGRGVGLIETQTGLILGGGALLGMFTAPVWGFLSEKLGRRPVLIVAMSAVAFSPFVFAVMLAGAAATLPALTIFLILLGARCVQAAFGSALIPVTQAYAADITDSNTRAAGMGFLGAMLSIGTIAGALLVWLVGGISPVIGFATIAAAALLAFVLGLFFLPEPKRHTAIRKDDTTIPLRTIWPYLVITSLAFTAYSIVQPIIGLRMMDQFGLDEAAAVGFAGAAVTAGAGAMFLSQAFLTPRLKWPPLRMLVVGGTGAFAGLLALSVAPSQPFIVIAMAVLGTSLGLVVPGNLAAMSLATGMGAQGKVAGINTVALGIGLALGPIVGTALYRVSYVAPFWLAVGFAAGITVIAVIASRRDLGTVNAEPAATETAQDAAAAGRMETRPGT